MGAAPRLGGPAPRSEPSPTGVEVANQLEFRVGDDLGAASVGRKLCWHEIGGRELGEPDPGFGMSAVCRCQKQRASFCRSLSRSRRSGIDRIDGVLADLRRQPDLRHGSVHQHLRERPFVGTEKQEANLEVFPVHHHSGVSFGVPDARCGR
jgi:hypothetical protein